MFIQGASMRSVTTDTAILPDSNSAKPARKDLAQPLHVAQLADALLKMQTVTALTGLSSSSVYRLVAAGELTPIRRGSRCTRFRAGDITAWLRAQGEAA